MATTKFLKRSNKSGWIISSVVVLAIVLSMTGYYYSKSKSTNAIQATLETSTIGTGDIILSASGLGTLIPSEEVSFGFDNSGKVEEVLVKLGDTVEAGQVLATQENSTIALEYKRAEANLAALSSPSAIASAEQAMFDAKETLVSAKDTYQHMIGPDLLIAQENEQQAQLKVQAAKDAVGQDASDENKQLLTIAETALENTEKILAQAKRDYEGKYLFQEYYFPVRNDNGITIDRQVFAPTEAEIATAQAAYELAKANLSDAQNYLDILNGTKTTSDVPVSSFTSITEAKIAFDQAKADLDATELIAPISGTITSVSINPGENVGTSAIITISNMSQPYVVDAYLDETDWDKAKVGYTANVTFDLLPDSTYPGKIIRVYPALDDSSGTSLVHILVQLDNKINVNIPAGATVSVDVTGGEALDVVVVPTSALKEVDGKYTVYLMKNGQPVEQKVEIGIQDILNAEVQSGLQTGDVVLTNATDISE
ncbi:MAG: efflux RND transporter periplasmic adaptor subunit [Anaerolineales bacterium]|nr:efflux RND transporter periplasmic adaptor subunit [Anaerolineales bacterium]